MRITWELTLFYSLYGGPHSVCSVFPRWLDLYGIEWKPHKCNVFSFNFLLLRISSFRLRFSSPHDILYLSTHLRFYHKFVCVVMVFCCCTLLLLLPFLLVIPLQTSISFLLSEKDFQCRIFVSVWKPVQLTVNNLFANFFSTHGKKAAWTIEKPNGVNLFRCVQLHFSLEFVCVSSLCALDIHISLSASFSI